MKLFRKYMLFAILLIFTGCSLTGKPEPPFDYSKYEFVPYTSATPLSVKVNSDIDLSELAESDVLANVSKRNLKIVDIISANKASKFAVGYENGLVDFYNWADLKKYKTIDTQVSVRNFKINSTASLLAVLDNSFNLKIYNISNATVLQTIKGVNAFAFSDVQDYFVVGFSSNVIIYQYSQMILSQRCDIPLTESTVRVRNLEFAPMRGLIGVHFIEEYHKAISDNLHIYEFGKEKSKVVAHHVENGLQDFKFLFTNANAPRIVFLGYNGDLQICRMSDFGDRKTLVLEGKSFEFKLSNDSRKYTYRLDKTGFSELVANSFISKQSIFPVTVKVEKNARFEFSPASDAMLVEFPNSLRLINLELKEFTIDNKKINWLPGKSDLANANVKITQTDLQENGESNSERETNQHNFMIALQNEGSELSRVWGEMIFKNRDEVVKKFPVYFGKLAANMKFTRNVKFRYPEGMLKGEPSIELKIHAGDKILAEQTISIEPSVKPVPNLKVNWYFAEESGNSNGIIEPGDEGKLHLLIKNEGRADAIVTSFKLNQVVQDVLKIEAGGTKNLDFTFGDINFEDKFKSLNISIEYSNALDIESETIKLVKDVYLPVSNKPLSENKINPKKLYVVSKFAYLRSAPTNISHPLAILNAGTELTVSKVSNGFYKIDSFVNSAGDSMPVWVEESHFVSSKERLNKIGIDTSGIFEPVHVFDAPPLIVVKETKSADLDSYVPKFSVNVRFFTPEGQKNVDFTKLLDGEITENKSAYTKQQVNGSILEQTKEFDISLAKDRSATTFKVTDQRNQNFEYKLNLNLRKVAGNLRVLVVGISEYEDLRIPKLETADNDAQTFAKTLQEIVLTMSLKGLAILIGKDATKKSIEYEIDSLVRTSRKDDVVIIYFSGHSTREIETNKSYLLPYKAKAKSVYETGISINYLKERLNSISSKKNILIFENTSEFDITNADATASFEMLCSDSTSVMLASNDSQRSGLYPISVLSLFTSKLIEGLAGKADKDTGNKDGLVTIIELADYVSSKVSAESETKGEKQNPVCNMADTSALLPLTKLN